MATPTANEKKSKKKDPLMAKTIVAAVAQMCARQDLDENLATAEGLVRQAAKLGAQLVVLPENFTFIGGLKRKLEIAEDLDASSPGPVMKRMISLTRDLRIHLVLGGIPMTCELPDKFVNTAVVLGPDGSRLATYQKIHLFDINIDGGPQFQESDYVKPGTDPVVAPDVLGVPLGLSICYDLRFPELYRTLTERGARIICTPAAFTLHTGKDHWFPLIRARAIENQVFILAAAQHGPHNPERSSYGKACIVDPWGAVLAQVPDQDGVAVAVLDLEHQQQVRAQLPALEHRRL
jgi:predicted amidohydrolase